MMSMGGGIFMLGNFIFGLFVPVAMAAILLIAAQRLWRVVPAWLWIVFIVSAGARLLAVAAHVLYNPLFRGLAGRPVNEEVFQAMAVSTGIGLINGIVTVVFGLAVLALAMHVRTMREEIEYLSEEHEGKE